LSDEGYKGCVEARRIGFSAFPSCDFQIDLKQETNMATTSSNTQDQNSAWEEEREEVQLAMAGRAPRAENDSDEPLGDTADSGVNPTLAGASSTRTGSEDALTEGGEALSGTGTARDDTFDTDEEDEDREEIEDGSGGFGSDVGATSGRTTGGTTNTGTTYGGSGISYREG
jgi:hypothetical protein